PHRRRAGTLPADRDRPGLGAVTNRVSDADPAVHLAVGQRPAVEIGVHLLRDPLGPLAALAFFWKPPDREEREVAPRAELRAPAPAPELRERGMLPRRGLRAGHSRVNREQRGAGHAVLQAR